MLDVLRRILTDDPRIAYALVFGSRARGEAGPHSDLDVAVGLSGEQRLGTLELGALTAKLEDGAGRSVDLVGPCARWCC
jgi:predicted nucleotidyltransferase